MKPEVVIQALDRAYRRHLHTALGHDPDDLGCAAYHSRLSSEFPREMAVEPNGRTLLKRSPSNSPAGVMSFSVPSWWTSPNASDTAPSSRHRRVSRTRRYSARRTPLGASRAPRSELLASHIQPGHTRRCSSGSGI